MGTNPDGIFLCVNLTDSINYISRTISGIEGLVPCKVIGIAVYPLKYTGWGIISNRKSIASSEEISAFERLLVSAFNLPTFVINKDSDEDIILDAIYNYFRK